ncbi:MAG: OmpH family outer membrane protein [Candidatus Gastranaerophilales bacterium]|nr:OmpH family outer membrane protein [Candidatus Gastranaerophilales bacterium]
MKKSLLTLALCSFTFGLGFGMNNIAFSNITPAKVAYVNVPKLLNASKTLKAAQETQVKETKDMLKWYDTASADIQKQTTEAGKKALIKKYEAQLTQKKKTIKETYSKKVTQVDTQLDTAITTKAKAMGYELVLRKDAVLFGGTDITAEILPLVK